MTEITNYLIDLGFTKLREIRDEESLDFNKFSCIKRIHEITYLFWSEEYKYFSLGVRHENPKGEAGVKGKKKEWNYIMIPKLIRTIEDAESVLNGVIDFSYIKVIQR